MQVLRSMQLTRRIFRQISRFRHDDALFQVRRPLNLRMHYASAVFYKPSQVRIMWGKDTHGIEGQSSSHVAL